MQAVSMIHTKRWNQRPHTEEELGWWIEAYTRGDIPDYQMSAWLMAVCWRGMTAEETACLTKYMVQSGAVLKWDFPTVDKHSTGGVGDKISLVLAPLVAACGNVKVPMMAGRGLDHTGGTLDKLESIPGYQTQLSVERFREIVESVGCSIVSASKEMVLADRKLYALRDVTGTVSSIPLQTASIVSKKIAEGPDSLVLDVKYGKAAFQQTAEEARELAQRMISTAQANGVCPTEAFLTRMDHPIGYAVGNWLEVKECIDLLKTGQGADDLKQLVVVEAAQMLQQAFPDRTFEELVDTVLKTLMEGKAYVKFREMVEAHGGDISVLDDPESYPEAKFKVCDDILSK
jgi:pyrimidine-nucleoside phosphorylase